LVQETVVFFPILSKRLIFSRNYVVSTYFANAQLTPPFTVVAISQTRGGPPERTPEKKGDKQMRAYYVKVFRHMFSMAVLAGFVSGGN
jgi:hypothetical protein